MSERKQIIKDTFKLTSARYIAQVIGFFTSFALRRFMGPLYMGIWNTLSIILEFSAYLLLGVNEGVSYKIPILRGQKKDKEEDEVKDKAFSFIFIISVMTGACLLITAIFFKAKYPIEIVIGLFVLSFYIVLERICGYYMLLLRAKKDFSILSKYIVFDAFLNFGLVFLIVRKFNIYGFYFALILTPILNTLFVHSLARYRINLKFNFSGVGELIKIGFPLNALGIAEWFWGSIDRIMIVRMLGVISMGYYSIPMMIKGYIGQLSSFGTVLYPRLLEDYGKNQRIEDIKKYTILPIKINAYVMPFILGSIFFIVPLLIKVILPKFIPGILAMQILLIDMFFRSCYAQPVHFLIALKKQARIIPIIASSIAINAAVNYILIKKGYGICGVAWSASIASCLTFIILQTYAMRHFSTTKEIFSFFTMVVFPFAYTLVTVLMLQHLVVIRNVYVGAIVKAGLLFLISIPLFIYINKMTNIIGIVLNIIKESLHKRLRANK